MRLLSSLFLLAACSAAQTLTGSVVNAGTGAPIAGARVKLVQPSGDTLYTRTGPDGRFQFPKPDGSSYAIDADAIGYRGPRRCSGLQCSLTEYAIVSGQVTDPDGLPVPYAQVRVSDPAAPGSLTSRSAVADDRGRYRVGQIEPGSYSVAADQPRTGFGRFGSWEPTYRRTYYPGVIDVGAAKSLRLGGGTETRVDIRIAQRTGVTVSGRLSNLQTGDGLHISLILDASAIHRRYATSAVGDTFDIPEVLPGNYTLVTLTQSDAGEVFQGAIQPLEVAGSDVTGVAVALKPISDLKGTVVFADGCKPGRTRILPQPAMALYRTGATPDVAGDGTFTMRLYPNRYTLRVVSLDAPRRLSVVSVQLDGREIPPEGFTVPVDGNSSLRVTVGCPGGAQ